MLVVGFRSYRNSGVGKASSDISMASLLGANKIYAEDVVLSEFRSCKKHGAHFDEKYLWD
jgi:hypothetical protein